MMVPGLGYDYTSTPTNTANGMTFRGSLENLPKIEPARDSFVITKSPSPYQKLGYRSDEDTLARLNRVIDYKNKNRELTGDQHSFYTERQKPILIDSLRDIVRCKSESAAKICIAENKEPGGIYNFTKADGSIVEDKVSKQTIEEILAVANGTQTPDSIVPKPEKERKRNANPDDEEEPNKRQRTSN